MEQEIWKNIIGYEGLYQISNIGRVKSFPKLLPHRQGGKRLTKEKILIAHKNLAGYYYVNLYNNKIPKNTRIHRLVAQAFILNPNNKPCINHINGIKTDNRLKNLERVTYSENHLHAYRIGLKKPNKTRFGTFGKLHPNSKPVLQYNLKGRVVREWECAQQVERELEICNAQISRVCLGKNKTAGGFIWKFK